MKNFVFLILLIVTGSAYGQQTIQSYNQIEAKDSFTLRGKTISEISTDTLLGSSDKKVSTQKAVKINLDKKYEALQKIGPNLIVFKTANRTDTLEFVGGVGSVGSVNSVNGIYPVNGNITLPFDGGSGGTTLNGTGFVKANGTTISYDNTSYISDSSALHQQLVNQLAAIQANASAITLKQNQLNGTGFVKASGTTISYDNSTYVSDTSALHQQLLNQLAAIQANASAITLKQTQLNGTGFVKASGTSISYDNTAYLPLVGGTLTGTAGNGFIGMPVQNSAPAAPAAGLKIYSDASNRLSWINPLGYSRTIRSNTLTGSRLYTVYDKDYTFADSADVANNTTAIGTKQNQLNGTGIVKFAGTTPSFITSLDSTLVPDLHSKGYYDGIYPVVSFGKNASRDSTVIVFANGLRYASKDSVGAGGGGSQWTTVNTNDIYYNTGNVGIGSVNTPTSRLSVNYDNIGVAASSPSTSNIQGLSLENNTASTSTTFQYSPILRFRNTGWKTNATAASQTIDWRVYSSSTSGAATPATSLLFDASINGASYANAMQVSSSGNFQVSGFVAGASGSFGPATFSSANYTFTKNYTTGYGDGYIMFPVSGATSGVPVQNSPSVRWQGNAWNGTANEFNVVTAQMQPIAATPTRGNLVFAAQTAASITLPGTSRFAVSTDGGVIIYPMTKAQRDAIVSPQQGRVVFVSDNGGYLSYYNAGWFKVSAIAD